MDGDSVLLVEIQYIVCRYYVWLLVDDVYGIGVIGDEGWGICWQWGVKFELLVVIFGKGFGVSGVVVLCLESVVDYLL